MSSERQDKELELSTVAETGSLRDVMMSLEVSGLEIVLVLDVTRKLVGILTDGDVRRALLAGAQLEAPLSQHMVRKFTSVGPRSGRAEVTELMQARCLSEIPVVDEDGKLQGLHLLRDVIGTTARENWAVIMCGGRGARLAPLTDEVPKPMLRVAGRPILERIVLHLFGHGVRRIFLAINYLGHVIENHFGDGTAFGVRIEYLREQQPLGTAGALSLLPEKPAHPLLVMNGDLVTQADVGAMIQFHESGPQTATMAVRKYFHTVPFGCVDLDGDRLTGLEEKPTLSRLVNAGMYVLDPALLLGVAGDRPSTMPEIIGAALRRKETVRAFEIDDDWIDVGQREQLKQARGEE